MALRMAVNDEPGDWDRLLEIGPELLKSGGRMVAISFMSIDDRKVKQKFRALAAKGVRRFLRNTRCSQATKRHRRTRPRAAPSCARWRGYRTRLSNPAKLEPSGDDLFSTPATGKLRRGDAETRRKTRRGKREESSRNPRARRKRRIVDNRGKREVS